MVSAVQIDRSRILPNLGLLTLVAVTLVASVVSGGSRHNGGPVTWAVLLAGLLVVSTLVASLLTPVEEHGFGTRLVCGIASFVGCFCLWILFAAWRDGYGDFPLLSLLVVPGIGYLAVFQKRRLFAVSGAVFIVIAIFPVALPGTPVSRLHQRADLPFQLVGVYRRNGKILVEGAIPVEGLFRRFQRPAILRQHWEARIHVDQGPLLENVWLLNRGQAVLTTKSPDPAKPFGSVRALFFTRSVHVLVELEDLWQRRKYTLDYGRVAVE